MPKVKQSTKSKIKELEGLILHLRNLRETDTSLAKNQYDEIKQLKIRIALVAAENETLLGDKKWYRQVIQHILEKRHAPSI